MGCILRELMGLYKHTTLRLYQIISILGYYKFDSYSSAIQHSLPQMACAFFLLELLEFYGISHPINGYVAVLAMILVLIGVNFLITRKFMLQELLMTKKDRTRHQIVFYDIITFIYIAISILTPWLIKITVIHTV